MPAAQAIQDSAGWSEALDRLTFYSDFRLRLESDFNTDSGNDRHRQRLRARFGVNYQMTDELLVGGRVVTGDGTDGNSTHVTLGGGFDDFELSLDRVFLAYNPDWLPGAFATLGKFDHPFIRNPVYSEVVWDADIQPEGAVVGLGGESAGVVRNPLAVLGVYTLQEQANGADALILATQVSGGVKPTDNTQTSLAVGYYHYTDVRAPSLFTRNRGNAVVDTTGNGIPDAYASEFGVLNPIFRFDYLGWSMPFKLSAEFLANTRARIPQDDGWVVGASLGSTARKGDLWTYYQYQDIGQDALFSPLAQDDFLLRTNYHGHVFGVNYQLLDKVGLNLWTLVSARNLATPIGGTQDQWRLRLDLNVRL